MENCAHCNWGLTTLLSEVNVRVIVLFSLFDRTQGRVRGEKRVDSPEISLESGGLGASRQDKRNGELRSL